MSAPSQAASAQLSDAAQAKFDLGIWHSLFNWQALTVAVQGQWGGSNSSDKRDGLAGAISEILAAAPDTDHEDIEVILLQYLEDEFDCRLEDGTEVAVAKQILEIKQEVERGEYGTVERLQERWEQREGRPVDVGNVQVTEHNVEGEWDSVDEETDEDEDQDGDVEMGDAPQLVSAKPKPEPEVDADGFEKVVRKKRK
ncbi:pre-rRNA-processing protein TSR2 [Lophiotrema nucula]|uniref:Pre-rRNA-processing protein TSR2 n=1 Tax=Lophiotrema nucula TaxID=690887 RepID=A0A6A5ZVC2_9PLEO|nr:pre-rRNA-processing protein TSR2 [Lophiotrema nucula]